MLTNNEYQSTQLTFTINIITMNGKSTMVTWLVFVFQNLSFLNESLLYSILSLNKLRSKVFNVYSESESQMIIFLNKNLVFT